MVWHKPLVGTNSWSIVELYPVASWAVAASVSHAAEKGSLSSDRLFPPCTSTNSLYSYMRNQVNDGSVQLSSSVHCCTNACASVRCKEDAGPLGKRQRKDRTAVTASVTTEGRPVPAVGQICTTHSARRVISFFPRDTPKKSIFILSVAFQGRM